MSNLYQFQEQIGLIIALKLTKSLDGTLKIRAQPNNYVSILYNVCSTDYSSTRLMN